MIHVVQSNRLDVLARALAERIREPGGDPRIPDTIVIPNGGMARWVQMELARAHGVAAHLDFRLPAECLWQLHRTVLGNLPERSPFEPEVLAWRIAAVLPGLVDRAGFEDARAYLRDDDPRLLHELARRLAGTFDRYLVYRPDWIRAWDAGQESHWQSILWRAVQDGQDPHRVALQEAFEARIEAEPEFAAVLPRCVSLFAVTALPPAYLQAFAALGRVTEVALYLVNPCREWWGDIVPDRDSARRAAAAGASRGALHFEAGQPLLASFGRQGRDVLRAVVDLDTPVDERFVPEAGGPAPTTMLEVLQRDVLDLVPPTGPPPFDPGEHGDGSIQVHGCHGPMREVEVLHDRLRSMLAEDDGLTPSDILVMAPDIETYAPLIDAVFGSGDRKQRIPFSVADRTMRSESTMAETLLRLLELPASRYEADRVVGLLDVEPVRRKFGLTPEDLVRVRRWIAAAAIRWEIDAEARAAHGLPRVAEHTWRAGLDRLVLGYAVAGDGTRPVFDILPVDGIEGADARALGRFHAFAETAFALRDELAAPRRPQAWFEAFGDVLDRFFSASGDDETDELLALRSALRRPADDAAAAGFEDHVPLEVAVLHLQARLDTPAGGGRFLTGGVTFCAMVPMRNVPFEVVCLLGMNADAFPRRDPAAGFDRMQAEPRAGDRSRRDEDRYLFLEALLAARRRVVITHVAGDMRDDARRPPCGPVAELLDWISTRFDLDAGDENQDHAIALRHALQPFSRSGFEPAGDVGGGEWHRRFSYRSDMAPPSTPGDPPPPFLENPLPAPEGDLLDPGIEGLVTFFKNPARAFLARLGIRIPGREDTIESREPFAVDALERWSLKQALRSARAGGLDRHTIEDVARSSGRLPHAAVGTVLVDRTLAEVDALSERVRPWVAAEPRPDLEVDRTVFGVRIAGRLTRLTAEGAWSSRQGRTRVIDRLDLWLRHLLLCSLRPAGVPLRSTWIADDGGFRIEPVPEPDPYLADLMAAYLSGLRTPLPFLPASSWAWATTEDGAPHRAAAREFESSQHGNRPGEGDDPAVQLAFRGREILREPEFEAWANRLLRPLARFTAEVEA